MSPSNVTSRSDARTIAMLRRKLAAAESCLNHYKNGLIVMREFVEDTDISDEEDVVLSNNFIITQCNQLLSTNINNIDQMNEPSNVIDLVDETDGEESDEDYDPEDEEMQDLVSDSEDEETDVEMSDLVGDSEDEETTDEETDYEMDVDYENLIEYIEDYGKITINGKEYFIDNGNYTGHANLLMLYNGNGDLEPIGTYIPNDDIIIYETFGYSYCCPFSSNSVLI